MGRLRFLLSLAALFAAVPAAAGAQERVEPVPGLVDEADAIVAGPDGAMWASLEADPGRIARITTAGAIVYAGAGGFAGFPANRHPSGVVRSGSAVWFRLSGGPETFARLRLGYPVSTFSLAHGRPTALAGGPDGALWMTVDGGPGQPDGITRFTTDPAAELTRALPSASDPRSIVAAPDGALWFAEGGRLGRLTTSGELTYRSVGAAPAALAAGPPGTVWFAQGATVRQLDDDAEYATGSPVSALAAGPDGALWAGVRGGVVRVVPGEAPTALAIETAAVPRAIAAGPDGRMWVTLDRAPYLVKITVPPRVGAASEAGGWLSALVNPNGLEAVARAELREPEGTWRTLAETEVYGTASAVTVRLRLPEVPAGEHVVRVTVTSSAGRASSPPLTIGRAIEPEPTATPIAGMSPTPAPTATPAPSAAPPPASEPVEGKSVQVAVISGSVSYRVPPATRYTKLTGTATLPLGVLLETTKGKVRLTSVVDAKPQAATFNGGKFSVSQTSTGMTETALAGALTCSASERAGIAARAKKKKKRLLWGKDSGGSFRTRGNGSVATVRGTEWQTVDTCAGTTIYVRKGAVSVWPRRGGLSKLVRAGQRLFSPRLG
jgi:streptogramin lyase